MLGIYRGCPAVFDPTTGLCVIVFANTARGWSRASGLVQDFRRCLHQSNGDDLPLCRFCGDELPVGHP